MAPIQHGQYIDRNDKILKTIKRRSNQKLCSNARLSYISNVIKPIRAIKSKIFLLRDKFMENWNSFGNVLTRRHRSIDAEGSSLNESYNSLVEYCR